MIKRLAVTQIPLFIEEDVPTIKYDINSPPKEMNGIVEFGVAFWLAFCHN